MKPKNFGKLIAHLRKEQRDEYGQPYTQKCLAQKMGVGPAVISNMDNSPYTQEPGAEKFTRLVL